MKLLWVIAFLLCLQNIRAQSGVLVFKEKNRTIRNWTAGDFIHFQYVTTQWIDAKIKHIASDSIFLNCFITRQVPNLFGFPTIDTSWLGPLNMHVSEIIGMPGNPYKSGIFSNGTLFKMGSAGYIFLNLFNSIQRNEQIFSGNNLQSLGIASGVFMVGVLQSLKYKSHVRIRKKYSMQIISINTAK